MPRLRLTLLGGFEARLDAGSPIRFPRKKAQALLAYLALQPGQAQPRDKLAALLWGDATDEQARHGLRQVLVALRRALATTPPVLVEDGDTVAIDQATTDIDVVGLERLVAEGTPAALAEVAVVYRGDLLAGLAVREAPFEEWLLTERERLHELAVEALARLLAHQTESGEIESAIQTAVRLLGLDSTLEPAHRALMRLYAQQGRRGAALRQYQVCVGILDHELGTGPETETRELYQHLLQAVPAGVSRLGAGAPAPRHAPRVEPVAADTPLIGRDAELARLRQARDMAWQGRGGIAMILGEAGIGKSRLLEALVADSLAVGGHVLLGHAWETERILSFGPWVDALRAGQVVPDLVEDLGPRWRNELARLFPELGDPARDLAAEDYLCLFEAMARVVEHLAAQNPILVVLEDLHWADEMSLRLLAFLARRTSAWPVLLAGTVRTDELVDAPILRRTLDELGRNQRALTMTLSALAEEETAALSGSLTRTGTDERATRRLAQDVWRVSRGNPFMAIETIRALREGESFSPGGELPTPIRVREVIAGRLDRLTEPGRRLAAVATVIGREFEFALLVCAARVAADEAARAIEELVGRRIFHAVGEHLDFTHDVIREVAYARLLVPHRRLLHAAAARAIEEVHTDSLASHALALGRHYYESEEWERAFAFLRQAGLTAAERSAHREAVAAFDQALAAFERLHAGREQTQQAIDVRFELRQSLFTLGDIRRILDCLRDAEKLARALDDEVRVGWASALLTNCLMHLSRHEEAVEAGERARAFAEATGSLPLRVWSNYYLGVALYSTGDFARSVELHRANVEALVGARAPERFSTEAPSVPPSDISRPWTIAASPLSTSQAYLALSLAELGAFDEGLPLGREAVESAERLETPWIVVQCCLTLGIVAARRGDFDRALIALRRSFEISKTHDLPLGVALIGPILGWVLAQTGQIDEAMARLEPAAGPALSIHLALLAEAYLLAGRRDEAAQVADRGRELCIHRKERGYEAWATWLCGRIAASQDPPDATGAEAHYRRALDLAEARGMRPVAAHCHLGIGELHANLERHAEARHELGAAVRLYKEMGMTLWLARAEAELARIG